MTSIWFDKTKQFITLTSKLPRWRLKSPASRLFTQSFIQTQIKENIKAPRHWPLCGEFTGNGEFPAQRANYAENVSIWWRHHDLCCSRLSTQRLLMLHGDPALLYFSLNFVLQIGFISALHMHYLTGHASNRAGKICSYVCWIFTTNDPPYMHITDLYVWRRFDRWHLNIEGYQSKWALMRLLSSYNLC